MLMTSIINCLNNKYLYNIERIPQILFLSLIQQIDKLDNNIYDHQMIIYR